MEQLRLRVSRWPTATVLLNLRKYLRKLNNQLQNTKDRQGLPCKLGTARQG